jgi:hypothetical protein
MRISVLSRSQAKPSGAPNHKSEKYENANHNTFFLGARERYHSA